MKYRIIALILICSILVACSSGNSEENYEDSSLSINTLEGLLLQFGEELSASNLETLTVVISNFSDKEFMYDDKFLIEKSVNDEWKVLPCNQVFEDNTNHAKANQKCDKICNIKDNYGTLPEGKYRLIVTFTDMDKKIYNIAREFNVVE